MDTVSKHTEVSLVLSGRVSTAPELVSKYGSTKILSVMLESRRLSGAVDKFCVHFPNTLDVVLTEGMYIELNGDIRSVNVKDSDRVIYPFVMATHIKILPGEPETYKNEVELNGVEVVRFDGVRNSYSDPEKSLATYRICVERKHGRRSYFRVTTWGRDAIFLGNIYKSVERLHLKCRLQSYISKQSERLRFGLVSYYLEVPDNKKKVGAEAVVPAEERAEKEAEVPAEAETQTKAVEPETAEPAAEAIVSESSAVPEGEIPVDSGVLDGERETVPDT